MSDKYLVWSHEHGMWWRPNSAGYTKIVAKAGRYDRDEAIKICRLRDGWDDRRGPPEIPVREQDAMECAPHLFNEPA